MKILALNGSRRKQGNTDALLRSILAPAEQAGAATEILHPGDYRIEGCTGCEACGSSWDCVIRDDFAGLVGKMDRADGIVFGSPTYWYTVTSDMKRFIDRCYSLLQYPESRHQWIGKYRQTGKACVTAAVCEQTDAAMMGNTLSLLSDFSRDIGLQVVDSVRAMGFFSPGSIKEDSATLQSAGQAGEKLLQCLRQQL